MVRSRSAPLLIILDPDLDQARRIELRQDYTVVGRTPGCDVRLEDPHVSRAHAALSRRGDSVYVEDLGSAGGTFIDGTAVTSPRELRPGHVVTFATVTARFEPASTAADDTDVVPAQRLAAPSRLSREAFPHEAAVTKTKALWLSWIGILVFGEGLTIIAATDLSLLNAAGLARRPFGPDIAGLPGEALGSILAVAGLLLLAAGIRLRDAASAWRRRSG